MDKYYLVARNIENDEYKFLQLKSKWYLKQGTDILKEANKLEAIDLVTTRFKSKEEMAKRLCNNGYLNKGKYDFYIVSKYRRNNENKLKYQEVIYNKKQERTDYFRKICYDSLNGNIKNKNNINLLDRFITKCYYNSNYQRIINNGLTALPYKFTKIFGGVNTEENIPYHLKYKSKLCLENYGVSRSIIDSFNRFDELNTENIYKNHVDYFNKLTKGREIIHKKLLQDLDKNYIQGQISLFDKKKDLTIEEKRKFILKTLTNLKLDDFNNCSLNIDFDNLNKEELRNLKNGLNKRLEKYAYLYNLHKARIDNNLTYNNYELLLEDMRLDLKGLKKLLNNDKIIDKNYNFCKTYKDVKAYKKGRGIK